MAELTVEEARKIYNESDSLKSLMLTKFSKEELEKHEVTQEEFDKTFLELLGKCTKTVFLDEYSQKSAVPTNRIELRNDNNGWLFDIQFTGKHKRFWVSYYRIWKIFEDKYNLQDDDIERLMKNQMKIHFGLDDITPSLPDIKSSLSMKIHFGLDDITPTGACPQSF